jgi:hypothetical protein
MKKIKYLTILAIVLALSLAGLACSQPAGYASDNTEVTQTDIPILSASSMASVTETAFDTDTTDHYVDMPATVNEGDLLIAFFTNDGSATVTTPAGWTKLASTANGAAVRLSVYYKIAAGTEGGTTVNFVTSAAEQAAAQVYRITDWHGTTPPEVSTAATSISTRPNPASLNPAGWDVADTLWLAVAGQDRGDQSGTTAYPLHYTDGISTQSSDPATTGVCRIHSARRVLAVASEDPGAFTIPVSEEWVAFTIAVRPSSHNLTTSSTEGGSVTEPGEGMFTYDEGTVVDLVAEADEGYRFDEWTGDVSTIEDVYASETTITMNGDYSITANFIKQYDLTLSSTEGGSVTEPGEGVFTYDEGTVVDLIATPGEGYRFDEWTGDVSTIDDVYAATTTIPMNGDYSITANFVKQYDLTTSSTEGGLVTEPGEGMFTYDEGTVVDLVAEADEGYRFDEWTGDVSTIDDVYAATTTIPMNGDYSITANFIKQYDLTLSSTEGGSVTEPGEGVFTYDEGTVVDLIATPGEGYRFDEWTGDVSTIDDVYAATTTIPMNGDYSITANFVKQYDLTTSSTEGGSVTEPGEGVFIYDMGTVVDLIATPGEGYRFDEWTGDVSTIDDVYAAATTITMNGDYSITANFEEVPPSPVYPTVTTQAVTNITTNSTTLNMSYTVGDFNPVEVRFAYKKPVDLTWSYTDWVSKSAAGTYAASLTGLDSDTTYDFKAQLKYDDTVIEGATLQFTTGTPPPWGSGVGGCFIATAAYGTPTAKQIDVLREFRDVVLMKSTVGSQFVSLYYRFSPPIANVIARHELLRTLVRELVVDPIVHAVEATGAIWRN